MHILPIHTGHLHIGDDLVSALLSRATFQSNDILAVSSKVIAITEGNTIDLSKIIPSPAAIAWADRTGRDAAFYEAVLAETERLHGRIINDDKRAILTELRPEGFPEGTLMAASAGLDRSNIEEGSAVGWPLDPIASLRRIRSSIEKQTGCTVAVLITDSCLRPRRLGVVAQALVVSGFNPIASQIGHPDLHGNPLRVTTEAVADQLATAANFVMGNADQAIPAALLRDHGVPMSDFEGWVPGIAVEEDLFHGLL